MILDPFREVCTDAWFLWKCSWYAEPKYWEIVEQMTVGLVWPGHLAELSDFQKFQRRPRWPLTGWWNRQAAVRSARRWNTVTKYPTPRVTIPTWPKKGPTWLGNITKTKWHQHEILNIVFFVIPQEASRRKHQPKFFALVPEVDKITSRNFDLNTFWHWLQKSTKWVQKARFEHVLALA